VEKIPGLNQLRENEMPVVRRDRRIVDVGAVVVFKANKPGILDPIALRR
jgi:hypothetical protein